MREKETEKGRCIFFNFIGILAVQVQILSIFNLQKKKKPSKQNKQTKNIICYSTETAALVTQRVIFYITAIPAYHPVNVSWVSCQNDFNLCILISWKRQQIKKKVNNNTMIFLIIYNQLSILLVFKKKSNCYSDIRCLYGCIMGVLTRI